MRGSKTDPQAAELAVAQYAVTGSVTKAAQAAGLALQTAYDVITREPSALELHRAQMESYVAGAWITAGRVDTELRRALDDPEWVGKSSPKDLAVMHSSLIRTVALVGDALGRVNSVAMADEQNTESSEDIRSAAMQFVGNQYGLSAEDVDFVLTEYSKA